MKNSIEISTLEHILSSKAKEGKADWISKIKGESLEFLKKRGLPTLKNENWKYTDISQIYKYDIIPEKPKASLDLESASNLSPERVFSNKIVFVNGIFMKNISKLETLPNGIIIKSISDGIEDKDPVLGNYLTSSANLLEDSFVNLNNLFMEKGVFIHIKKNIVLDNPIHITYLNIQETNFSIQHPRILMIAEKGSKAIILEEFYGKKSKNSFINHVTEIFMDQYSDISHYLIQNESKNIQVSTIAVDQNKDSKFSSQLVSLGGKLTRNNIHSKLSGEKISCIMNGVYIIDKKQHLDNATVIDHKNPDCISSQIYHGILSGSSRAVFFGKINVSKNAKNTISTQTNRSLMLSDESHIDTKPQLEIFNDEVQCSHAATIGQINEESLYYLRSRGISHKEAKKMLTLAFSHKVTEKYESKDIRDKVEELINKRMDSLSLEGGEK